jgi:putative MATE family efflux protein
MRNLTEGSINGHLARMAGFMLFGMIFQTLYLLVDLYFVARVGPAAIAAVGLAASLMMVTIALTQALTVGATSLIARAIGAKDMPQARRLYNQTQVLSLAVGLAFVVIVFALRGVFARGLAADAATVQALHDYLDWFVPAMGVQFLMVAIGAALRGAGEVRAPMLVQLVSVIINVALCPVLIAGWGTGHPMGISGAGLASFIAIVVGAAILLIGVRRKHDVLTLDRQHWKPDFPLWGRMLGIGLPAGGEFLLITVFTLVIYYVIRDFGAEAQAGFGIGMRVMQTGFMPALAIAFSIAPIAGQNLGAGNLDRVRATFRSGVIGVAAIMLFFMALAHISPSALMRPFSDDANVVGTGADMLTILSYNFLASGIIMVAGGMFQALGNTVPSLLASALRIMLFAIPALYVAKLPGFRLQHLWWLSVVSVLLQLAAALFFLRREFRRKLPAPQIAPAVS